MRSHAAAAFLVLSLTSAVLRGEEAPADRLVRLLSQHWTVRLEMPEIQQEVAKLGDAKDAAIDRLISEFRQAETTFAFRHRAVRVLEAIASPKAQQALLDIALGRMVVGLQPSLSGWAARAYIATLRDKADARNLLESKLPDVLNSALLALQGQPVDKALLARLQELIRSDELAIRRAAAAVLAQDPREEHAAAKVAAILGVIPDVPKRPKSNDTWWPGNFTHAEGEYHNYVHALAKMRGADEPLKDATAKVSGPTHACVVLARANRGDRDAREAILKLAQDPEAGRMREWAVRTLGRIGEREDMKLLEKIAQTDPLERERGGCLAPLNKERFFPVRDAAREVLRALETRGSAK